MGPSTSPGSACPKAAAACSMYRVAMISSQTSRFFRLKISSQHLRASSFGDGSRDLSWFGLPEGGRGVLDVSSRDDLVADIEVLPVEDLLTPPPREFLRVVGHGCCPWTGDSNGILPSRRRTSVKLAMATWISPW